MCAKWQLSVQKNSICARSVQPPVIWPTNTHYPAAPTRAHVHAHAHTHRSLENYKMNTGVRSWNFHFCVAKSNFLRAWKRTREKINAVGQEYQGDINRSVGKGWDRQQHEGEGGYFQSNLNQAESPCRCSSWINFQKNNVTFVCFTVKMN